MGCDGFTDVELGRHSAIVSRTNFLCMSQEQTVDERLTYMHMCCRGIFRISKRKDVLISMKEFLLRKIKYWLSKCRR
ncbi:hypothetical protein RB195_008369 [Necator americanus]